MFRYFLSMALVFGLQVVCSGAEKIYEGDPLKVLLVTGGGAHDYKRQAVILPGVMTARAVFDVDVLGPDLETVRNKLEGKAWAEGYDLVVYNICIVRGTEEFVHNIVRVHEEDGVPAVVIHGALHSFHWGHGEDRTKFEGEEWLRLIGVVSANHGPKAALTVKTVKSDHPIMKGIPAELKTAKDELYNSNQVLPSATPLAMANNGTTEQPDDQVCVWVNTCGQAKVFGISLGHYNDNMKDDTFGNLLVRGMLWSCGKL
jgi:type 1 glutamine amidotransferase